MPSDDSDDADTVPYQFETPREVWRQWTNTLPRSQNIDDRLITLIEHDYRSATRDANDDSMNDKTLGIFATRIRIRAMQALGAIRDGDDIDTDTAESQLEELIDMADVLEK